MILLALLGCPAPEEQPISGHLRVGPYAGTGPLTEGTITIWDASLQPYATAEVEPDGRFEVMAPVGQRIVAVVEGPGMAPAHFMGTMGLDPLEVPDGELFAYSEAALARVREAFGACVGDGPLVVGEMRIFGVFDEQGESPILRNGWARLVTGDATVEACYLGEDGTWDPSATRTGPDGSFVFSGQPPGVYPLSYGYDLADGQLMEHRVDLVIPRSGVVPLFPAWVDLP